MGRFGDWAKGPWKDTVRVAVGYTVKRGSDSTRYEIIVVIPKSSLNFNRDAAEKVLKQLSRTVKPPDLFKIESTTVEGEVPFIGPLESW